MRKNILDLHPVRDPIWLPLAELATVSVSSEDPDHPIEGALVEGSGWRAATPGPQLIRIQFDQPQVLRLIHLVFEETQQERVHEFALQWSDGPAGIFRPIVRQQFSFSPNGATRQEENYTVDLDHVTVLELQLIPDISHRSCLATLTALRVR